MQVSVFDFESKVLNSEVNLSDEIFNIKLDRNFISMHFARMKKYHYIPTNKTKHIAEISGTTRKPYKQKHTGNARQGSLRSAQFRGGGIAFGPRGLKRNIKLPKYEVSLAKSMVLSEALANNSLFVVSNANFSSHKSANAKNILNKFSEKAQKVVIIHDKNATPNSLLAVRNIQGVRYCDVSMLTTFDILNAHLVIIDISAIEKLNNNLFDY